MLKITVKPEVKRELVQIRDYKLLILGVLIGIIGSLVANVIDSFIKKNNSYPLAYIIILFLFFAFTIFTTLKTYFKWTYRIFKIKRVLKQVERHHP